MFDTLTEGFSKVFDKFRSRGKLTEENVRDGMREVRMALLEADVNYKVARDFIARVTEKAVGLEVLRAISPTQQIVKIVHDEMAALMSPADGKIPFVTGRPTVIMLAGLQGGGKTTTCAKLAVMLKKRGRKPLMVAADVKRPAAKEQLAVLGRQVGVPVWTSDDSRPVRLAVRSVEYAEANGLDTILLDTAGRLHVDEELMEELEEIARKIRPAQTYLVCDSMTGQDAVKSTEAFNRRLELDGVILTKLDGDARGGAALSVRAVTGKPIKFIGTGEKIDQMEEFFPDRMASRILGMGDIVTLVERAKEQVDEDAAQKMQKKLLKGKFDLEDFMDQMQKVKKMGGVKELLGMIPGIGSKIKEMDFDEKELVRLEAIIRSMTPVERRNPDLIDSYRRRRIAKGSGTHTSDVNQLLKQFKQMNKMMKGMAGGPKGLKGLKGKFPIGGF